MPMTPVTKVVGTALASFLLLFVQPFHADARSFRIDEVDIHARVGAGGDMDVNETDTYRFEGAYNGIVVNLGQAKSDGIEGFQAFEVAGDREIPLRTERTEDGDRLQYKIYDQAEDEPKVFRFTYTVRNAVQVYADTAELYWKFFDDTNPSTLDTVNIDVELPEGVEREAIAAYGHGPSQGDVNVEDDGTVRYRVSPLPPEKLLEVRLLFPVSAVPGSTRVSREPMLEKIKAEEQGWTEPAGDGNETVYGALALLIANVLAGLYVKFGRRFKSEWRGDEYRELPGDAGPAVVGYLMKGRASSGELMATVVDLARKRRVEVQAGGRGSGKRDASDHAFRLLDEEKGDLQPHEAMLIDWFFGEMGHAGQVSLADIRRYAKSGATSSAFLNRWSQWRDEVARAARKLGYVQSQRWLRRLVILAVPLQFFGFWFLAPEAWRWLMFCALPLLFFIPKSERRTRAGQTEYAKWLAFKRFLREYGRTASGEPLAAQSWEHYLVYAIPLGAAKEMEQIPRLKMPNARKVYPSFDDSYIYYWGIWSDSFERTIGTARTSSSSSSDDSGGSFSSGGGGGGGGGGRGAF